MKESVVYGFGINDAEDKASRACVIWRAMLQRCFAKKFKTKHPTYIDCSVCEDWLRFSNFNKWYESNYVVGFELDKDILFPRNKVYHPEYCLFVPRWLNAFVVEADALRGELPVGVRLHRRDGKYTAHVYINNRQVHLGTFKTAEEGHAAWKAAKLEFIYTKREELDSIDLRLFPSLVERYTNYA